MTHKPVIAVIFGTAPVLYYYIVESIVCYSVQRPEVYRVAACYDVFMYSSCLDIATKCRKRRGAEPTWIHSLI